MEFIKSLFSEDNLLVGTRQGHLLTYSVTQRSIDQKHEVQLLQYCKTFSKKPIQQLEVIPEYQLLVCLTGKPLYTQFNRSQSLMTIAEDDHFVTLSSRDLLVLVRSL